MLQVREKVSIVWYLLKHNLSLTAGSTVDKEGSRADEGREEYQERATADSGDETEGGSSVFCCVCSDYIARCPPMTAGD